MTFDHDYEREHIIGVSGGVLPIYLEGSKDSCGACSCRIGEYMHLQYRMPFYDGLPGSAKTDTKHELVMAYARRLSKAMGVKLDADQEAKSVVGTPEDDFPF